MNFSAPDMMAKTRWHCRVWLALAIVPGLAIMSRALPPGWPNSPSLKHGSGSTQIILLLGGMYVGFVGLFICRALLPVAGSSQSLALSRWKRLCFALIVCFVSALAAFALAELSLRALGQRPWHPIEHNPFVVGGGQAFAEHATLGYTHVPGKTTFELADGYTFTATHLPNTLRVTSPLDSPKNLLTLDETWIFGCSYTHGWTVNDNETYPWLLDQMLSDHKVANYGVTGYGTLHSLIQLREALARGERPKVAVLAYASFHDERNTFQRSRRKIVGTLPQPYARLDEQGRLRISNERLPCREFSGMRHLAVIHALERYYNQRETATLRSHEVSRAIIDEMAELCTRNQIQFIVAGIDREALTSRMLRYCSEHGMSTVDIAVDLQQNEYNNQPHDGHPSAVAHHVYADKLYAYLIEAGLTSAGSEVGSSASASSPRTLAGQKDHMKVAGR